MLDQFAEPWRAAFEEVKNAAGAAGTTETTSKMIGTLEGIKQAVERDLLITVEDLVIADAFADLLGQAEYLFSEGYVLAAGVLGRAVLEEHLQKLCERGNLTVPSKPKPTIATFKAALQQASKLSKLEAKQVDALADVGNDAAHGNKILKNESVEWFLADLSRFLLSHPLS